MFRLFSSTKYPFKIHMYDWSVVSTHKFILWVDVIDDAAVLDGCLHIACPQGLDNGSQRDDARDPRLGEDVKLYILLTAAQEVWTTVQHYDSLVGMGERHSSNFLLCVLHCGQLM